MTQKFFKFWPNIKDYSVHYEHEYADEKPLGLVLESDGGDCWVHEVEEDTQSPATLVGMKIKTINGVPVAVVEGNKHLDPAITDKEKVDMRNNVIKEILDQLAKNPRPTKVGFEGGAAHKPISYPRSEADQMPEVRQHYQRPLCLRPKKTLHFR